MGWSGHRKAIHPGITGSYERLFHDVAIPRFCCPCATMSRSIRSVGAPARAANGILLPETERARHYFHARLPEQFDFVLHFDQTKA